VERIAIFAALQWECRCVLTHLRQASRDRVGAAVRWRGSASGREVWLVKTGIGLQRAGEAVGAVAGAGVELIVSTGCAGGLVPSLRPGDLAVATAILDGAAGRFETDAAGRARALRAATAAGLRAVDAPVLCSGEALATSAAKHAAAAGGAVAVEMEGAATAAYAVQAGVRFVSVRAVLDAVEHELQLPATLVDQATGTVRPLALTGHVVAHPGTIPELIDLQRLQRAASASLTRFFERWLAALD